MGHTRLETTASYLRRKDIDQAKELNRDLSWGASVFSSQAKKPPICRERRIRDSNPCPRSRLSLTR